MLLDKILKIYEHYRNRECMSLQCIFVEVKGLCLMIVLIGKLQYEVEA